MEPVKYQLTKREYVITLVLDFWRRKRILFANTILLIMVFICFLLDPPLYNWAIFIIAWFIFAPLFHLHLLNKIVKSDPDLFTSEKTLSFDDDGIKASSITTSLSMNWSVFKKWTENRKYIFLHYNVLQPSIIPKRAFTNEQLIEFKKLLADKIRPS